MRPIGLFQNFSSIIFLYLVISVPYPLWAIPEKDDEKEQRLSSSSHNPLKRKVGEATIIADVFQQKKNLRITKKIVEKFEERNESGFYKSLSGFSSIFSKASGYFYNLLNQKPLTTLFNNLPPEIIHYICKYMKMNEILQFRLVSTNTCNGVKCAPHTSLMKLKVNGNEACNILHAIQVESLSLDLSQMGFSKSRRQEDNPLSKFLASSKAFKSLRTLHIEVRIIGDNLAQAIAINPYLINLTSLTVNRSIGFEGVTALTESTYLINLIKLDLGCNLVDDEGAKTIATNPSFINLTELNLEWNLVKDNGAAAIADSPYLANLKSLKLGRNEIGNQGTAAIAKSTYLINLTKLDLGCNLVDDEGAKTIATNPSFINLTELNLKWNFVRNAGAATFIASPHLANLTELTLQGNLIGETAARSLKNRFGDKLDLNPFRGRRPPDNTSRF